MPQASEVLQRLNSAFLRTQGATVSLTRGNDRPELVALHPTRGAVCVSATNDGDDITIRIRSLNQRIASLRAELPEIETLPITRLLISNSPAPSNARLGSVVVARLEDVEHGDWLAQGSTTDIDLKLLSSLAARLSPEMRFVGRTRRGAHDAGAGARADYRFALDAVQAGAAQRVINDVLLVSGPPGSGKTLVLVARARWLAARHPDWKIVVLAYNRLLSLHIERLLRDLPNVVVSSFGVYCRSNGHRISLRDESESKSDVAAILHQGVAQSVDALLIDEWQDFHPAWITYGLAQLKPERGGACFAGDVRQSIYRHGEPLDALRKRSVERVVLDEPYRSTRQILAVVSAMTAEFATQVGSKAPEGEPVDIIQADTWDGQASAIAWEIRQMLDSGQRLPDDIGVLVTQRIATIRRLRDALEARDIPYALLDGSELPMPGTVSLLTVHQAKGYEFDVVLLMGLEALPKLLDDPERRKRCRVGFVGPTRAKDQLMITYSRSNEFLRNLRPCKDDVLRVWTFPDDYEDA